MATITIHDWLCSLKFGERYYKPESVSWEQLEHYCKDHETEFQRANNQYWQRFQKYRIHRMRGNMFCLECRCCGSVGF